MKYMMLVIADPEAAAEAEPRAEDWTIEQWLDDVARRGKRITGSQLRPTSSSKVAVVTATIRRMRRRSFRKTLCLTYEPRTCIPRRARCECDAVSPGHVLFSRANGGYTRPQFEG